MSTYKCENPECGKVFKSNNPLSCPKCDTLEFSTIHIKSNKKLLVFGLLILLIGAGLVYLNNDESSNTESERTESEIETIKFNGGLMYSTTSLNVRMKPNKNSEKVTSLKLNTPVLTNTKDIGGWVLIADTDSNKLGYVYSKYLSPEKITNSKKLNIHSTDFNSDTNEVIKIYRKEGGDGKFIEVPSSNEMKWYGQNPDAIYIAEIKSTRECFLTFEKEGGTGHFEIHINQLNKKRYLLGRFIQKTGCN